MENKKVRKVARTFLIEGNQDDGIRGKDSLYILDGTFLSHLL